MNNLALVLRGQGKYEHSLLFLRIFPARALQALLTRRRLSDANKGRAWPWSVGRQRYCSSRGRRSYTHPVQHLWGLQRLRVRDQGPHRRRRGKQIIHSFEPDPDAFWWVFVPIRAGQYLETYL